MHVLLCCYQVARKRSSKKKYILICIRRYTGNKANFTYRFFFSSFIYRSNSSNILLLACLLVRIYVNILYRKQKREWEMQDKEERKNSNDKSLKEISFKIRFNQLAMLWWKIRISFCHWKVVRESERMGDWIKKYLRCKTNFSDNYFNLLFIRDQGIFFR